MSMSKSLVIVESPTKARTLSRFLDKNFQIEASMGHVRDLPKAKLGVDTEHDFAPEYVIPKDKRKVVENLKHLAEKVDQVILATDPDREGEAIAYHLGQVLGFLGSWVAGEEKPNNQTTQSPNNPALPAGGLKR